MAFAALVILPDVPVTYAGAPDNQRLTLAAIWAQVRPRSAHLQHWRRRRNGRAHERVRLHAAGGPVARVGFVCCCALARSDAVAAIADDDKDGSAKALKELLPKLRLALSEMPLSYEWRNLGASPHGRD